MTSARTFLHTHVLLRQEKRSKIIILIEKLDKRYSNLILTSTMNKFICNCDVHNLKQDKSEIKFRGRGRKWDLRSRASSSVSSKHNLAKKNWRAKSILPSNNFICCQKRENRRIWKVERLFDVFGTYESSRAAPFSHNSHCKSWNLEFLMRKSIKKAFNVHAHHQWRLVPRQRRVIEWILAFRVGPRVTLVAINRSR